MNVEGYHWPYLGRSDCAIMIRGRSLPSHRCAHLGQVHIVVEVVEGQIEGVKGKNHALPASRNVAARHRAREALGPTQAPRRAASLQAGRHCWTIKS